jgi:NAD(P)-dependent dehydrogenase (short-subunit alcohol dehydrogenase family)
MEIGFDGKAALVTGASRGIGRAIALELARSGADVAVNYHTHRAEAEDVSQEIREMGHQSIAIRADVANSGQVARMVERVSKAFGGGLDILVNNAGIYPLKEVVKMTDREWNRVVDLNLRGAFYTSREAAKKMIQRGAGGRIIGIASGAGHSGRPGQAHYCASKAGLILLCKTLSLELAPYGINVNTISVGFVDVGQYDAPDLKHVKKDVLRRILLRRPGRPEDIAHMVAFLASEQAGWITGTDFRVDGGESAGRVPERDT